MAQIKSKKRVADHGEVFTAEREVKAMCDLVAYECFRIDSRFLEPACGDGNFLAEILTRKLTVVKDRYKRSPYDWERNALLALGSVYGVDILSDNCTQCRERLLKIWVKEYKKVCRKHVNEDTIRSADFILERNIVCGNALTLCCVDEEQRDTKIPIVFSEWSFPMNNAFLHRKDFTFAELLDKKTKPNKTEQQVQLSLFSETESDPTGEGNFVQEYICHYRRLGDELADPSR